MAILTVQEFNTLKLYEVDDVVYRRIEDAFRSFLGCKTQEFMRRHLHKTIREMSCTDLCDVMGCFLLV